jgi:chitin-binding protein
MNVRCCLAMGAVVAVGAVLWLAAPAAPAAAHGALSNPVSRASACGPEGADSQSPACVAAVAASGGSLDWDNIRVADVNGRDRQVIPDGKLCSGGLDRFRGLDLARGDWPATRLREGQALTFRFRTTIQHPGTFRLYVTHTGYDPAKPLRWSDLDPTPFLTAKEPPVQGGAYVFSGSLPRGRSGRHLIYTIWQTTPDTYYSCSDVVFGDGTAPRPPAAVVPPAAAASPAAGAPAASVATTATESAELSANAPAPATTAVSAAAASRRRGGYLLATGVALVAVAGAIAVAFRRRAWPGRRA